mmetsp:Transcript_969/g.2526  ORF Transcript_969/g.2526 Transcript_969/m.2526 type:complete len:87 (+) Transcript_969:1736-1996(+)
MGREMVTSFSRRVRAVAFLMKDGSTLSSYKDVRELLQLLAGVEFTDGTESSDDWALKDSMEDMGRASGSHRVGDELVSSIALFARE